MTDHSELKRLAEHMNDLCGNHDGVLMHVTTAAVLALIAENELLRGPEETVTSARGDRLFTFMSKDPCRYRLCEVTYAAPVRVLRAERDQLKTDNELLRKDAERLNWLDGQSRPVVEGQCMASPEGELTGYDWGVFGQCATVREAIDDAMSKGVKP
jgi:hypothetical protein